MLYPAPDGGGPPGLLGTFDPQTYMDATEVFPPYLDALSCEAPCWFQVPGATPPYAIPEPRLRANSLNLFDLASPQRAHGAYKAPTQPPGVLAAPPGQFLGAAGDLMLPHAESYEPGYLLAQTAHTSVPLPRVQLLDVTVAVPSCAGEAPTSGLIERPPGFDWEPVTSPEDSGAEAAAAESPSSGGVQVASAQSSSASTADPEELVRQPSSETVERTLDDLPSEGSRRHQQGNCKPCAFVLTDGCKSGTSCKFCHLCEPGEKKMRKKRWKEQKKIGIMAPLGSIATPCRAPAAGVFQPR